MSADRVKWEHIHKYLSYAIEMFLKLQTSKCRRTHKEFFLKDHLNKFLSLTILLAKNANNKILVIQLTRMEKHLIVYGFIPTTSSNHKIPKNCKTHKVSFTKIRKILS